MAAEIANPSVSIQDLSLNFGAVSVLQTLNLDVGEGEFIVLLGPSGCGKSTLLNCIAGLLDISDGRIFIKGKNVTWEEPKDRGIGMVFQNYALYPHMNVRDNIGYALKLAGVDRQERMRRIGEAAELLGLGDLLERKPAQLSGGQRQRVAIGRAIARRQRVLLFDEPLSNLDAKLRHDMRMELRRLHDEIGATTIFVTHDQVEAMTLADRVVLLNQGRVEQAGAPTSLYHRPRTAFVAGFIGTPPMNLLEAMHEGNEVTLASAGKLWVDKRADQPTPVVVGIRPEAVVIGDATGLEARIEGQEDLGSHRVIYARVGRQRLLLTDHSHRVLGLGETVHLGFPPQAISLFEAASGQRIEHVRGDVPA